MFIRGASRHATLQRRHTRGERSLCYVTEEARCLADASLWRNGAGERSITDHQLFVLILQQRGTRHVRERYEQARSLL